MMSSHDEEPIVTGDPTQRLLTALGRFQRQVSRAENAAPKDEWCEACMAQVVTGLEIAIEEEWDNVREALIDTARVLQTYEEYGCPEKALPFLKDAYEILCLMVGDLLVDNFHSGVVKKWRERYRAVVVEIEAAGMKLLEDEQEAEQEVAPEETSKQLEDSTPANSSVEVQPGDPASGNGTALNASQTPESDWPDMAVSSEESQSSGDASGDASNDYTDDSPFAAPQDGAEREDAAAEASNELVGNDFFASDAWATDTEHEESGSSVVEEGATSEPQPHGAEAETDPATTQASWNAKEAEAALESTSSLHTDDALATAYDQDSVDFVPEEPALETSQDMPQAVHAEEGNVEAADWDALSSPNADVSEPEENAAIQEDEEPERLGSETAVEAAYAEAAPAEEDLFGGVNATDAKVHDDEDPTTPAARNTGDDNAWPEAEVDGETNLQAQKDLDASEEDNNTYPDLEAATATLGEYTQTQAQVGEPLEDMQDDQNNVFDAAQDDSESTTATMEAPEGVANADQDTPAAPDSPEALWQNIQAAFSQGNVADAKVVALQLAAQMAHLEVKKAEEHVQALEDQVAQDQEAIESARSALDAARKEAQDAEWILGERKAELSRQQESRQSLEEEMRQVQDRVNDLDRQLAELQQSRDEAARHRNEIQERIEAVQLLEVEIEEKMQTLQDTEVNNQSMFALAEQELAELEAKRQEHADALESAQNKLLEQMFSEESIMKTIQSFSGGDAPNAPDHTGEEHAS